MILSLFYYLFGGILFLFSSALNGLSSLVPLNFQNTLSYFISPVFKTLNMLAPVFYAEFVPVFSVVLLFFTALITARIMFWFWNKVRGINSDKIVADKASK